MTKSRLYLIAVFLLLVVAAVVACVIIPLFAFLAWPEVDETGSAGEMGDMTMSGAPEGLDTSTDRMTDEGLFHVSVSSNLDPLVLNEIHSWTVHVETADGQAVENAQISVDGGMPEHNHGFPTTPEITEDLGGGDYLLEGVKFSMAGWWELKLIIDDGDRSDQVTFNLVLP